MPKVFTALLTAIATLAASSSIADTITLEDYPGAGVSQSGSMLGLDIYAYGGSWIGQPSFGGDGIDDLFFGQKAGLPDTGFFSGSGQSFVYATEILSFKVVATGPATANAPAYAKDFSHQSHFDPSDLSDAHLTSSAVLFDGSGNGALDVANNGIFGFVLQHTKGDLDSVCRLEVPEKQTLCVQFFQLGKDAPEPGSPLWSYRPPQAPVFDYFGFLKLSRGSVIGSTFGVNTAPSTAVALPPVPLPASALLLGLGLASLGAWGRWRLTL